MPSCGDRSGFKSSIFGTHYAADDGECLRYYVLEYHIDGFILNPVLAPMEAILADPLLKRTKILQNKEDFQITMRRFLKGDEGMVPGVMWWLKQQSKEQRSCNYITSHNGARSLIMKMERDELVEEMLKSYIEHHSWE